MSKRRSTRYKRRSTRFKKGPIWFKWKIEVATGFAVGVLLSIGLHAGMAWLGGPKEDETSGARVEAVAPTRSLSGPAVSKSPQIGLETAVRPGGEGVSARTAAREATAEATSLGHSEAHVSETLDRDGEARRGKAAPVPALRPADSAIEHAALPAPKPAVPVARPQAGSIDTVTDMGENGPIALSVDLPDTVARGAAPSGAGVSGPAAQSGVDQGTEANQVFADAQPIAGSELDELRGGFFEVGGWQIAFGIDINVKVDSFEISSFVNPMTNQGGFKLKSMDNKVLARNEDGTFETEGDPTVSDVLNGKNFNFGEFQATVEEKTDGGFDLTSTTNSGDQPPVQLSQSEGKVTQKVGTEDTTLIKQNFSPTKLLSLLQNRRHKADVDVRTKVDLHIFNHEERVSLSHKLLTADRLTRHIQSGLISRIVK